MPGGPDARVTLADPTLLACAFRRQRLYLFSSREPSDTEDAATGRCVCMCLCVCVHG